MDDVSFRSLLQQEQTRLRSELRASGLKADMDHAARSLKAQFKYADKLGAPYVITLAGDELEKGVVRLRDMGQSTETEVPRGEIVALIASKVQ